MTSRDRSLIVSLRLAAVVAGGGGAVGSAVFIGGGHAGPWWSEFYAFIAVLSISFAAFTWLVAPRQPRNAAVWTMTAVAFLGGLYVVGRAALIFDHPELISTQPDSIPTDLPLAPAALLMAVETGVTIALLAMPTLGLLLFPDGRLPSPRWRWVGGLAVVAIAATSVGQAWSFRPGSTTPGESGSAWSDAGAYVVVAIGILAMVSLVRRFRSSHGAQRQQFKWIVWGASLLGLALISGIIVGTTEYRDVILLPLMLAAVLFTASYGIAIGRYRLYDIDLVISKTVTYVLLVVVVAAMYGGAVLGLVLLFGDPDRGGVLELPWQLGATAVVAIAFEPLRMRLQRLANRVAYGERAAPAEVLSALTSSLADTSAGEGLTGLARLMRTGTGADQARVWLRSGERLRLEVTLPEEPAPSATEFDTPADLPASDTEISLPVRHGDELLGAIGITKPRTHPVNPADESLLADIAAGAGLLLRNLRLNAQLAERALEVQASRRRLIAATDAARHRLERDLHDGAQQQVVALKVRLGIARTVAEREGLPQLAERVSALADNTQKAVDDMRMVARGIYPPLLDAEGLGAALVAVRRTHALPIEIAAGEIPRYAMEVEQTAYFCVLAAITRAQMAGAGMVRVEISPAEESLAVVVAYDTPDQGDLTQLTDRIDGFGGTLGIDSTGSETTLTIALPATNAATDSP